MIEIQKNVNQIIGFVYVLTGARKNTIDSIWKHSSVCTIGSQRLSLGPLHICGGVPIW